MAIEPETLPAPAVPEAEPAHDAFISYSRVDRGFATALAKALESYKAPRDLELPQRHLRVFRDESDFTGVDYFDAVEGHLASSSALIVVCSPAARRSKFVDDEIRRFAASRGAERVVPVLRAGIPNNEATDGHEEEKAFPEALCEFHEMPLAVDYLGFDPGEDRIQRGAFENAWYTLLANLFGLSRQEIEQRDKRRRARQRRFRVAVVGAFFAVIVSGLIVSLYSWRQAVIARDQAFSRELAAGSREQIEIDPDLSVMLAREALRVSPTEQAEAALREALAGHRVLAVMAGEQPVRSAALSPDGRRLATGGSDGSIGLWDVETGELLGKLAGHTDLVAEVAFSPDGRRLVTASWDRTAAIWDVAARRPHHRLPDHGVSVTGARFSPDGRLVATGDGDGKIRLWNAADGELVREIDAHDLGQRMVPGDTRVAFDPGGALLLTSSGDKSTATGDPVARLWETATGALVREFPTRGGEVVASLFSRDAGRVLVASTRDEPRVWEVASGRPLGESLGASGLIDAAAFSPDGETALTSDTNGNGTIWDAATGAARTRLVGTVRAAAFDDSGEWVAASDGAVVRVWHAPSGALRHILRGHQGDVGFVEFGRVAETLVTASDDDTARVWSLGELDEELELSLRDRGEAGPTFSHDGRWILARAPGSAMVWEVASGRELARLETFSGLAAFGREGRIYYVERTLDAPRAGEIPADGEAGPIPVAFPVAVLAESDDGRWVLTARDYNLAVVWDTASWREVSVLEGHQAPVTSAVFGPDSRQVLTVSDDGTVRVWDAASGQQERELSLEHAASRLLLSPDGRTAVAIEGVAKVTVWDAASWRRRRELRWQEAPFSGNSTNVGALSPDGALLAVGDPRGVLRIFDLQQGTTVATIEAHTGGIRTVDYSADGRLVLTAGDSDRGARVWDATTGARVAEVGTDFLMGASFSPDGTRVATLASSGTVRLYNWTRFVPLKRLVALADQRVKRDWTPGERVRYLHETPADGS